jgi:hypothetical protein
MTLTLNHKLNCRGDSGCCTSQYQFAQRRVRALVADGLSVSLVIFAAASLPLFASNGKIMLLAGLAWLIAIPGNFIFQRRNWRCPVCGAKLWGQEMRVDPLLSHEHLDCMYCNAHLID